MRQVKLVVFLGIDPFFSSHGKPLFGIEQFLADLDERGTPCVWLSAHSRTQLDEPRRRLGHSAPFIAESGSGVYLPEDYFHLKPEKTVRLGRFTCIPIAELQPAAREALEALSEETGVPVVPLRSLSPRELAQNTGLPQREAELVRVRDFDELFFFAGADDGQIAGFVAAAKERNFTLRQHGALWSLSLGARETTAIREVSKLYDGALHSRATRVGIAASAEADRISPACDRVFRLVSKTSESGSQIASDAKTRQLSISVPDLWDQVLDRL